MQTEELQNRVGDAVERLVPGSVEWEHLHADHVARYLHAATLVAGRTVVDAGTGLGYGAAILAEAGAASVYGIDIDTKVIEEAQKRFSFPNLRYGVDDCHVLGSVRSPVDVVCNFENIEHLPRPKEFLARAAQILKDDGMLLCSSPDREHGAMAWVNGRPANPHHQHEWFRDEFMQLLEEHFEDVQLLTQCRSLASRRRAEAIRVLQRNIDDLWHNPLIRVGRLLKRLQGVTTSKGTIQALNSPSPSDFPILAHGLAALVGTPHCHYAICRRPKR